MLTVNGNLVSEFSVFVTNAFGAFIPLLAVILGIFLAFAIADKVRFISYRSIKKS